MSLKSLLAGALFVVALNPPSAAFASANDYAFEPAKAEVKKGSGVTVTVRLVHKPTGKPVPNAVIFASRIDMSPEGMATMTAPLTAPTASRPIS